MLFCRFQPGRVSGGPKIAPVIYYIDLNETVGRNILISNIRRLLLYQNIQTSIAFACNVNTQGFTLRWNTRWLEFMRIFNHIIFNYFHFREVDLNFLRQEDIR